MKNNLGASEPYKTIGEITKEVYNWGIDILLEAVPQRGMTLREKANQ